MNTDTDNSLNKYIMASWVIVAMNFVIAGVSVLLLKDVVPTHFNVNGLPDKYGTKMTVLFLPLITLAVNMIFQFVSKRPADKFNYPVEVTAENIDKQYNMAKYFLAIMRVIVLSVMVLTNGMTISSMFIGRVDMRVTTLFVGLVIISVIVPAVIYGIKASKIK